MQFTRHYTLPEANDMLPWVRRIFSKVHQVSRMLPVAFHMGGEAPAGDAAAKHPPRLPHLDPATHGATLDLARLPEDAALDEALRNLGRDEKMELIGGLLQGILDQGIVIQDVRRGLIDFPATTRAGDEVLLCYELTDGPRIIAFHSLTDGFAGRQPISELSE